MALARRQTPLEQVAEATSAIHAFDSDVVEADELAPFSISALGLAFKTVIEAINRDNIPEYELVKLLDVLPMRTDTQEFDANFDLSKEITNQLAALQSIREKIFSTDGRIREGQSVKDAKDFMASSAQLLQMLQKSKAELINIERLQAIEEATISTLREISPELLAEFTEKLRLKLDKIQ